MRIGVLGTGMVGKAIATKLISLGHNVMMGSRTASSEGASHWLETTDGKGLVGTFKQTAHHGELLFNCTNGAASVDVISSCNSHDLNGKTLIDVSNALDFSKGFPPTLFVCNNDSLAERIQELNPNMHVVKTLNTTNCNVMVNPALLQGKHTIFLSGNDAQSKTETRTLLESFGWTSDSIIDLGDLTSARATEMVLPIWVRLYTALGSPMFNFDIVRA